jgi:hypothetical protein
MHHNLTRFANFALKFCDVGSDVKEVEMPRATYTTNKLQGRFGFNFLDVFKDFNGYLNIIAGKIPAYPAHFAEASPVGGKEGMKFAYV